MPITYQNRCLEQKMDAKKLLKDHIVVDAHPDPTTLIELERSRGNTECITEKLYHDEIQNGGIHINPESKLNWG